MKHLSQESINTQSEKNNMTHANGQKLNVHHGDDLNCKSCKKEQWEVCWNLSDDYLEYLEDGQFNPWVWNEQHIDIEKGFLN